MAAVENLSQSIRKDFWNSHLIMMVVAPNYKIRTAYD
jgi:hypothetical protein